MTDVKIAEIVEVMPTECWYEKDIMGTIHIKMKHQRCHEFDFIQIQYDHMYTYNSHQHVLAQKIGELLGYPDIQQREYKYD